MSRLQQYWTLKNSFLCVALIIVVAHYFYLIKQLSLQRHDKESTKIQWDQEVTDVNEKKSSNEPEKKLFNPFRDIKLTYHESNINSNDIAYSFHHCVNYKDLNKNEDTLFVERTCKYDNLYYDPQTKKFHYFLSPSMQNVTDIQRLETEMTIMLGNVIDMNKLPMNFSWKPEVHIGPPPESYAIISNPSNLVFLLYQPFYSFNLGHFFWDDVLSLFSMLDAFGMTGLHENDSKTVPLPFYVELGKKSDPYYRCNVNSRSLIDRWKKCTKMYRRKYPFVFRCETHSSGDILRTGNWLQGMSGMIGAFDVDEEQRRKEMNWNQMLNNTSLVLIPTSLAGTGKYGQYSCAGDCFLHRSSQLFSFRQFLIKNTLYPKHESLIREPLSKYITFSLPGGSSRPDEVSFFENVIPIAKEMFGEDKVKVVDMAKLESVKEEALIIMNTAVLFTNHGGGSAASLFLPWGSAVFLYSVNSRKCEGWCDVGKQTHFDYIFYSGSGYVRPIWIEKNERDDIVKIKQLLQMEYQKSIDMWLEKGYNISL